MGWNSVAEAHQFGATLFTLLPIVILLVLAVGGAWSVFKQFVEWKAQALDRHRQELETAMKAAASSREDARLILENERSKRESIKLSLDEKQAYLKDLHAAFELDAKIKHAVAIATAEATAKVIAEAEAVAAAAVAATNNDDQVPPGH